MRDLFVLELFHSPAGIQILPANELRSPVVAGSADIRHT